MRVALYIILGMLVGAMGWPVSGWTAPVAKVGQWVLEQEELDKMLEAKLYELREARIQEVVAEHVLATEAKALNMAVSELLEKQADAKVAPPSEKEVAEFIETNRAHLPNEGKGVEAQIREYMLEKKREMAREAYLKGLWTKYAVEILLQQPRVAVNAPSDLARGKAEAPVTIVEFSDFECPYCRRAQETLKAVEKAYGDKVRFVFRHYPLPFHEQAPKASEAAQCAADQDKFWPFHDALFAEGATLELSALKTLAGKLGLNQATFDGCLDSGRHAGRVAQDSAEGQKLGITGTPTFFVNGIRLVGAVPFAKFQRIIDGELKAQK
ncbi:MAG: thioredoxin domain-containing protein [Magnetococcales bacterium]|nr:thioredoxin domain-containing protein [Magnetococcales bacterium]